MWLKIRQPEELKAFNSLRLPVEDTVEATAEVLIKLASKTELAQTEPIWTKLTQMELV